MNIPRASVLSFALLAAVALRAETSDETNTMDHDPNLWMEEVTGEKPIEWVRAQNAVATGKLENVRFDNSQCTRDN